MPESSPQFLFCAQCGELFQRASRRGRVPQFCGRKCRAAAHRARGRTPAPFEETHDYDQLVMETTHDVLRHLKRTRRLARGGDPYSSSWAVLEQVSLLQREVDALTAVAVLQARGYGVRWSVIGKVMGMGASRARTQWARERVHRMLNRRREQQQQRVRSARRPRMSVGGSTSAERPVPGPDIADRQEGTDPPPEKQLSSALSFLQRSSRRSTRTVATELGVSPSYVTRLLNGERIPPWGLAQALAVAYSVDPALLRPLWDEIHGTLPAQPVFPGQSGAVDRAAAELRAAMRGLYLAGACPDPEEVAGRTQAPLTGDEVATLVEGESSDGIPGWPVVESVVTALHGRPQTIRPLWERVQVAADARWHPGLPPATGN